MKTAKKDNLTQSILEDDPWKLVKVLSLPAIIGMSINGINSFFDGLFVGQMAGQDALAAISLAFPLLFVTGGLSAMIGVGLLALGAIGTVIVISRQGAESLSEPPLPASSGTVATVPDVSNTATAHVPVSGTPATEAKVDSL